MLPEEDEDAPQEISLKTGKDTAIGQYKEEKAAKLRVAADAKDRRRKISGYEIPTLLPESLLEKIAKNEKLAKAAPPAAVTSARQSVEVEGAPRTRKRKLAAAKPPPSQPDPRVKVVRLDSVETALALAGPTGTNAPSHAERAKAFLQLSLFGRTCKRTPAALAVSKGRVGGRRRVLGPAVVFVSRGGPEAAEGKEGARGPKGQAQTKGSVKSRLKGK